MVKVNLEKLLTLETNGLGGPQQQISPLILRTPARLHGVEGKWFMQELHRSKLVLKQLGKEEGSRKV